MSRSIQIGLSLALLLIPTGCGESVTPIRGIVMLDGKPIEKGTEVIFVPEGDTPMATAVCDENGRFELKDVEGLGGLLPGTYKVVLTNISNYIPLPFNASPDDPTDPVWDAYQKKLEEIQNRPPQPGMLPHVYCNAATTTLRYSVPNDGSDAVFNLSSGAVSTSK